MVVCVVFRFVDAATPMNHDLGTYGYSGWRILEGDAVYVDIWNHKTPGFLYLSAAWMALFGPTPMALQVGATILMIASVLAFAAAASRIVGRGTIGPATALYAFHLFHPWWSDGGALIEATNTLPVILAATAAFAWIRGAGHAAAFAAGLAGGLAFWMKQPAGTVLGAAAVGILFACSASWSRRAAGLGSLTAGSLVIPGTWILAVIAAGRGPLVWDQIYGYNAAVYSAEHYYSGIVDLLYNVAWQCRFSTAILFAAAVGAVLALRGILGGGTGTAVASPERSDAPWPSRAVTIFVVTWAALDLLAVIVQDKYFRHHFVQGIPSWSLLASLALESAASPRDPGRSRPLGRLFCFGVVLMMVASSVWPAAEAVRLYGSRVVRGESTAAEQTAAWIAKRTDARDPIFVWGTDPVIYFLAKRVSPSMYYDCDAVMVPGRPDLAARLLADLRENPPAVIVDSTHGPDLRNHRFLPLDPDRPASSTPTPGFDRDQLLPLVGWIRSRYTPAAWIGDEYSTWVRRVPDTGTARVP